MDTDEKKENTIKKALTQKKKKVAVVNTARTPFVKSFGVFEQETALSLSLRVANEIISRTGIQASDIDECIWGVVIPQTKKCKFSKRNRFICWFCHQQLLVLL